MSINHRKVPKENPFLRKQLEENEIPIYDEFELENLKFMAAVEKGNTHMSKWDGKLTSI